MVSPTFPEQQFQQQLGARVRPQSSGLVTQPDERTIYNPAFHQVEQETPDIANILAGYPLDPTTTFGTTAQTDAPSLASLPTEIATELGSVVASNPVVQAAGGVAGGVMDIFGRLLNPQTSSFTGQNLQPYSPMFQPESLWGGLGREFVSGMTGRYPEGPIDHQSLSGPEQAFLFSDIADPSSVVGDVFKAGAKVIPEGMFAAGFVPLWAKKGVLKGTQVTDVKGDPQRVYHGTQAVFDEFTPEFQDADAFLGRGQYFTEDAEMAGEYAWQKPFSKEGIYQRPLPNVHAAYLSLQKPLDLTKPRHDDVLDRMADEIFSFAKSPAPKQPGPGAPAFGLMRGDVPIDNRAKDLKGFAQNLYNQTYSVGGIDANQKRTAIQNLIDNGQWDEAEEGLRNWFRAVTPKNSDVRKVVDDFFFYHQDNTKRWGNETWTEGLQDLGYDGMTDVGGYAVSKTGKEHRVWVVFEERTGTELSYENRIFPFADIEGMSPPPPMGETAEMLENIFRAGQ